MLVYQRVATGAVTAVLVQGLVGSLYRQALNGREKCLKAGAESVPDPQAQEKGLMLVWQSHKPTIPQEHHHKIMGGIYKPSI